jgi:disulfide bond formation protein DsbB
MRFEVLAMGGLRTSDSIAATPPAMATGLVVVFVWLALGLSALTLGGSLFLSLGMNLKACPLCFYQRTFVMCLLAVLGMGLLVGAAPPSKLALLALPLSIAGMGVAAFHVWLESSGKLECPAGILGLGSAPLQSLTAFVLLTVLLTLGVLVETKPANSSWAWPIVAVVLGLALAFASCIANPPPPAAPPKPYDKPPEICRPPHLPQ